VPRGQRDGSLRPYSRISRPDEDMLAPRTCVAESESAGELNAATVSLNASAHALSALRQHTHEDI
jgi:hypothetical protein